MFSAISLAAVMGRVSAATCGVTVTAGCDQKRWVSAKGSAQGFAEGPGDDVYAAEYVAVFDGATAGFAHESGGVTFVHHDKGGKFIG